MTLFTITPAACGATVEGVEWKLAFDMAAVSHFELATGKSFFDGVDHLAAVNLGEENPRVHFLGYLVAAGLLREHGAVDHETAMRISVPLRLTLAAAIVEAVPSLRLADSDGEGDDPENPPPLASDANDGISTT